MYRNLIYTVAFILIGGAGYYFHSIGVPDLIINGGDKRSNGVSALEVFSGTYVCDSNSGCQNITRIILQEDTTLDIIETVEGQDISLAQGTWGIGGGGALVLKFQSREGFSSSSPSSLIVKKISIVKLTGFSNSKGLYPGMVNPTFTREKVVYDNQVGN